MVVLTPQRNFVKSFMFQPHPSVIGDRNLSQLNGNAEIHRSFAPVSKSINYRSSGQPNVSHSGDNFADILDYSQSLGFRPYEKPAQLILPC